jgi:hypothetical protein
LKQEGKIKKDDEIIADLNNQLTESMKRSSAFIDHQNKVIEKSAQKEKDMILK